MSTTRNEIELTQTVGSIAVIAGIFAAIVAGMLLKDAGHNPLPGAAISFIATFGLSMASRGAGVFVILIGCLVTLSKCYGS